MTKDCSASGGRLYGRSWRTGISSFRGGVLTIDVGSAPLKHELEVFQREELLAALRERLSGTFVSELRFNLK